MQEQVVSSCIGPFDLLTVKPQSMVTKMQR